MEKEIRRIGCRQTLIRRFFRFTEEGATAGNSSGKIFHGLTGSLQTGIIRFVM
jgi:hypothetical protein